jgi:hypothetical protein
MGKKTVPIEYGPNCVFPLKAQEITCLIFAHTLMEHLKAEEEMEFTTITLLTKGKCIEHQ